ncbi:hypothetical protein DUI87_02773 [Hirundo rustica rustica]|uniref:ENV1 protein n=1 Tax=Hirundo rustica rustica TaxID=333673 RepID=A0A3M0L8H1_HIRRU|nr:hypothetical protein DUI87_02773 [Hirundo rustica rustica]
MAKKLQAYADAMHGTTHARIAALETQKQELADKMEENHKKLREEMKEIFLHISAVKVRGSGTTRKRSLDREGKGIPQAKLWVLLRECGENMRRWDGESTDTLAQRLHELLDSKTMTVWEIRDRRSEDITLVLYHQEEEMYHFLEETILLRKREVMTGITIAMLLGLGATGTATGVSALVTQHQRLSQLQMTIDEDLLRTEKSISSLERSISSLSEVVLQNRRGLDLLLMQQGGLCAALREECCFYADHTGVERDSMAELSGRLAQRKREREAQQGWFESWFNQSPWLATLVPTLIGPLTMILLTLIFGPCILNKLVSFVRRRLDKVDILFVERMQLS